MKKDDEIRNLLCRILNDMQEATTEMDVDEETEYGTLHIPKFRYEPSFVFTDDDIELIKWLEDEEGEDFSMFTEQ